MVDSGPSATELGIVIKKPSEIQLPPAQVTTVKDRISVDSKESAGMKILADIFPESQQAQVIYKYGWDEDVPNNGFDPKSKDITITLDVGYVEDEMKYMARNNPDALTCRTAIRTRLTQLNGEESIPLNLRRQLSEIATELARDPNAVAFGTDEYEALSFLGFNTIQELINSNISDQEQRQRIYAMIYGKALANSQFAVATLEKKEGTTRSGTINIEIHERTHFVNDRNFPTHLPNSEELERVGKIRSEFFKDEPLTIQYDSVTDKTERELSIAELIQINHNMMEVVGAVVSDNAQVREMFLTDARRNARDEVTAITLEIMGEEKPRHLRTVAFVKYATSGCHYFERDPNLDIAELRERIVKAETSEKKREIISNYLQNGFSEQEIQPEREETKI